jgi:hypothetical protein
LIQPLVSIVTPSYNQAIFLESALQSILAQNYPNIELLVVDGGSKDGSTEIIRRCAGDDDRLVWWVSEPDAGQAAAINKGMARARGEFVAWLNSDDLYLPGAISQAVEMLLVNPEASLVYGNALSIDAQGQPFNRLVFEDWGLEQLIRFRILCQPSIFMRRSTLVDAQIQPGVYLDPTYHFMLDHQLWIRLARLGQVHYSGPNARPWSAARQHDAAKNVVQAASFASETERILNWMETQPDLASLVQKDPNKTLGGAYRLRARYLLDANLPAPALQAYFSALRYWPGFAIKHYQRIAYACLCLLHMEILAAAPLQRKAAQQRLLLQARLASEFPELQDWPGIAVSFS